MGVAHGVQWTPAHPAPEIAMQLFKAHNIRWDCADEDDESQNAQTLHLPTEAYVFAEDEDAVADALSDRYGWCVEGLDISEPADNLVLVVA